MAESLEEYLQRLLQQAMEKQAPPTRPTPPTRPAPTPPVLEAEVVDLVEIPTPVAAPADVRPIGERPLGRFGVAPGEAETAAAPGAKTIAEEIVSLLHTPGGVQKAIILSEVLQRPDERW
jgi:hypothetical protein